MHKSFLKKSIALVATIVVSSSSYAYCIYNNTKGSDTKNNGQHIPTQIMVHDFSNEWVRIINQGDYACNLTKHRKEGEMSNIAISFVHKENTYYPVLCNGQVFNKGGYVMAEGYPGRSSCRFLRD